MTTGCLIRQIKRLSYLCIVDTPHSTEKVLELSLEGLLFHVFQKRKEKVVEVGRCKRSFVTIIKIKEVFISYLLVALFPL